MGDIPGALPDVDKSLALDPQYHQGFDSRADFRLRLNDLPGALADSNRASYPNCPTQPWSCSPMPRWVVAKPFWSNGKVLGGLQDWQETCD